MVWEKLKRESLRSLPGVDISPGKGLINGNARVKEEIQTVELFIFVRRLKIAGDE